VSPDTGPLDPLPRAACKVFILRIMKKRQLLLLTGCLALLVAADLRAVEPGRFTLVVNASRPAALSRKQVSDFFLRRVSNWPDGTVVAPIDLSVASPTRAAFSKTVIGQPTEGVVRYWQQTMHAGLRMTPPLVKPEDGVLSIVRSTPGGIGYVTEGAALPEGVKTVTITGD
jgi:ABC-type phosphate transport system substrate-binding protein